MKKIKRINDIIISLIIFIKLYNFIDKHCFLLLINDNYYNF
jgi:hypothetical protein